MSDISSVYSSTSRITGIYSNLDTDAIVKDLMEVQQTKVDAKDQEKTSLEWYNDALGSVSDLVKEFKSTYLTSSGSGSMLSSTAYKSFQVDCGDDSAVSVSAGTGATTGSYTVNSVTQLAKNASVSSSGRISSDGKSISEYNTTALSGLKFAAGLEFDAGGNISFEINGAAFTFSSDTTLQAMINTVNADETACVTMKYSRLTDAFTIAADDGGASSSVTIKNLSGNAFGENGAFGIAEGTTGDAYAASVASSGGILENGEGITRYSTLGELDAAVSNTLLDTSGELSFTINGKSFTFGSDTSILDMTFAVNSGGAGVKMSYDGTADTFSIVSSDSGADASITIENNSGNAFGPGGVFGIDTGTVFGTSYGEVGSDCVCTIEGVEVTRDSNCFTIDGLTYTLKKATDEQTDFTVSRDFTATVEAVKTFVDAYNTLTDKLNSLLDEKDYSADYKPLTSEQEDEMSENEIASWNDKAKSGLLRNNKDLEGFLRNLKNSFFSSLAGSGKTMASLGITTASYYSDDAGKIVLDEDALTAALEKNPDQAVSMFTASDKDSRGFIYKISDAVNNYLNVAGDDEDATSDKISGLETKISDMEDDLDDLADRYYEKFSVMEQSLSRLNSISSMLSSLLSS
ncbi:flagellar filament capping protein FliD [Papillibacter cinnamivorans]|uniref:Flagellar hook-associated protein 2 n=1 Tax=Papillibacter cinnamivorans DSM 12816 TaxID=1122930 RepID=A0A1W1YF32_9FIRM|nr:flagellar filament capping protein FliD [Papillibacter cinnamivorans]SMC34744.1 flagellar hook-associated protein 2 [Papillibacter cinnamivorans DSM 12816]